MRYSLSAAILAFAAAVSAAVPTADFDPISVPSAAIDTVVAGSTYTIKWTSTEKYTGTVTLKLLEGANAATLTLAADDIDTDIDNSDNEYEWDVPEDLEVFALYGIQISWDSDPSVFQWSFPFHVTGSSAGEDDSTSSSTTSAAAGPSPTSTKTVQVTPNSSYTSTPATVSTVSTVSTKASSASSVSAATATTVATVTSSTVPATTPVVISNGTLSTSGSLTPSSVSGGSSSTRTSAPIATVSASAAMANVVKGSFAVFGGAILALIL